MLALGLPVVGWLSPPSLPFASRLPSTLSVAVVFSGVVKSLGAAFTVSKATEPTLLLSCSKAERCFDWTVLGPRIPTLAESFFKAEIAWEPVSCSLSLLASPVLVTKDIVKNINYNNVCKDR